MKIFIRLILGCTIAALSLALLTACEQEQPKAPDQTITEKATTPAAKPGPVVDTGLVPDQASTGNPPLIPHEVDPSDGGEECLGCHKEGDDAPKIPEWHATLVDCLQCHVPYVESSAIFEPQY